MLSSKVAGTLLAYVSLTCFAAGAQAQTTWHVDDDNCPGSGTGSLADPFCRIQDAIGVAVDTDTVLVSPGTYSETINFIGKAITLRSSDGPDTTTIDATGLNDTVVRCESREGPDTVLTGFTITGGLGYPRGGGMQIFWSSPTVSRCTFVANEAVFGGGGMDINGGSDPVVTECTFVRNTTNSVGGGGISVFNNSSPTVVNCMFLGNTTNSFGGGMYNHSGTPVVINCMFSGNTASMGGGGISNHNATPTLVHCVLAGNTDSGIHNRWATTTALVANTIIRDNDGGSFTGSGTPTVMYSDIDGGYSGIGNIDADPMFVRNPDPGPDGYWDGVDDDYGDLHLTTGSPCVDAADNDAVPPDAADLDGDGDTTEPTPVDLDGNSRFVDDPATPDTGNPGTLGPPVVDMGVFEFVNPCGNGVIDPSEECDDGNPSNNDDCLNDCTLPTCGDGYVWNEGSGTEECDDGPNNSDTEPDACRTDCLAAHCCDGVVDTGEECDTGSDKSDTLPDACRTDCSQAWCGDGVVDTGEECDDGAVNSDIDPDACRATCVLPSCGDGVVDTGEECDDGLNNSATEPDACRTNCTAPLCGDGVVDTGEECDDGLDNSDTVPNACRTNCGQAWCGDGVLDTGEECDDGNTEPGGGCDANCLFDLGACCVSAACSVMTDAGCMEMGGSFFGFNSMCDAPDADGDGLRDECDGCPDDWNKIEPGICGCGLDDTADSDGDGVPDCNDQCPGVDDAIYAPDCIEAIPTVSEWGLVVMTLLLLTGIKINFGGRQPGQA